MTGYTTVDTIWLVAAGVPLGLVLTAADHTADLGDRLASGVVKTVVIGVIMYVAFIGSLSCEWWGPQLSTVSSICYPIACLGGGATTGSLLATLAIGLRALFSGE